MYTRSYTRPRRYSPPPGYGGSAVTGEGEVKHHPPENEPHRSREEIHPARLSDGAPLRRDTDDGKEQESDAPARLIRSLRGRFGSEELIILAVMLLISEDGIGPEVLMLAFILIAG